MAIYDSTDLAWSWDGDLDIDLLGDIKDTRDVPLQAIIDVVQTIVKSETLEWEKDPMLGADLSDFQGEPNTRETGKAIEAQIKQALTAFKTINSSDLNVRVVPVHANQVLISILINATPTSKNNLTVGEPLQLSLIYDTLEHNVFFLLPNNVEKASR